jgi:ABC-type transport system involved in multi-copper enzyme maturation permease subunit
MAERNSRLPELTGLLLQNRLVWVGIGAAFLLAAYHCYNFSEKGINGLRRKELLIKLSQAKVKTSFDPLPSPSFGKMAAWAQFRSCTRLELKQVFKSPAFGVLMALGLANSILNLWNVGNAPGAAPIPTTEALIPILRETFSAVALIIAIYFAGELVWRERDRKVHEMVDASPLPNWALVVPKTTALALVLIAILVVSASTAILAQLSKGYADIKPGKYLLGYILPVGFDVFLLAILSVFVQSVSPNKHVGWAIMLAFVVLRVITKAGGFEHSLLVYGEIPPADPNLYGSADEVRTPQLFRLYWGSIALLLLMGSYLLWRRGNEIRLALRLKRAPNRITRTVGMVAATAGAAALVAAMWIFADHRFSSLACRSGTVYEACPPSDSNLEAEIQTGATT